MNLRFEPFQQSELFAEDISVILKKLAQLWLYSTLDLMDTIPIETKMAKPVSTQQT